MLLWFFTFFHWCNDKFLTELFSCTNKFLTTFQVQSKSTWLFYMMVDGCVCFVRNLFLRNSTWSSTSRIYIKKIKKCCAQYAKKYSRINTVSEFILKGIIEIEDLCYFIYCEEEGTKSFIQFYVFFSEYNVS